MAINIEASGVWQKKMNERKTITELNKLGAEGWEVITCSPIDREGIWTHENRTYTFAFIVKRPQAQ